MGIRVSEMVQRPPFKSVFWDKGLPLLAFKRGRHFTCKPLRQHIFGKIGRLGLKHWFIDWHLVQALRIRAQNGGPQLGHGVLGTGETQKEADNRLFSLINAGTSTWTALWDIQKRTEEEPEKKRFGGACSFRGVSNEGLENCMYSLAMLHSKISQYAWENHGRKYKAKPFQL